MPSKSTGSRAARAVWRRLPPRVRHRIRPGTDLDPAGKRPLLSVVIPVYNVQDYLAECLDSALSQTLRNLEVIVVDDGSTDESPQIIADYARRDSRVHAYRQENAGQGPARNLGVTHARGTFLTFLDADDTIPAGSYKFMVRSLQASGSDFSIGSVRRTRYGKTSNPPWVQLVHAKDRIAITIDDFPDALQDVIACNRMFRRDFWVDKVGHFRGIAYEDHVPMVTAYVRATSFDILQRTTYRWRMREDKSSTSQQKHELKNLTDRVEVKQEAQAILQSEASRAVYSAWIGRVLDTDFPLFITHALSAGDDYRDMLREAMRTYVELATPETWAMVRVHQKVRDWLASRGAWDDLEQVAAYLRAYSNLPPTHVVDGRVVADRALLEGVRTDVPEHLLELAAAETSMEAVIQRATWSGSTLHLTGWAYIRAVDLGDTDPALRAVLVDAADGTEQELALRPRLLSEATWSSGELNANFDRSGFDLEIDADQVGSRPGVWSLRLEVAAHGLVRSGRVHKFVAGSSAGDTALPTIVRDGLRVCPRWHSLEGFGIEVTSPVVTALSLGDAPEGVRGEFVWRRDSRPTTVRASERGTGRKVEVRPTANGPDGRYRFELEMPGVDVELPTTWDVRVVGADDHADLLEWPDGSAEHWSGAPAPDGVFWRRTSQRHAGLTFGAPRLEVVDASVDDESIHLTIRHAGLDRAALDEISITNARLSVPATSVDHVDDSCLTASFPARTAWFGGPPVAFPSGHYTVTVTTGGRSFNADAADRFVTVAPAEHTNALFLCRFTYARIGEARLTIMTPRDRHERGRWAQRQLQTSYQNTVFEAEDSVLFQCYRGETATDSQLALHRRLRATRPDLTLYWGVGDHSTVLPEGAVALLIGSIPYYERLGRARYLSSNVDFDTFFRKQPHQSYLQTFHGYPFKSMGRGFWEGKQYSPGRIAREIERRNKEWDSILVPSEPCADMYRSEYDYAGQILVSGYPRSDVLVTANRDEVRAATLARLGVDPEATVVLYAPTYREQLTTRVFAAKRFDELDLDQLCASIGDDFVVLVRGHNNNQRELDRVHGKARVVDVTDYPEINDLTLAADVAVLDYSSLRFDWALTGKPMIFFVPDLDTYFDGRPPLFDFLPSAPGPVLSRTDEVAAALRDLDSVRADFRAAIATFNSTYNMLQDGHATERVVDAFFGTGP